MGFRKGITVALMALMPLSVVACSDEDDDGAVTDEELGEVDESLQEGADQLQEEIEEGVDELDDESG